MIPLAKPQLPVPNPANGVLSSPLNGTLTITQPITFSVPTSWNLPQVPPVLPVYPLTPTVATVTDAYTVAQQIKMGGVLITPQVRSDGSVVTTVQVGSVPYTLTVSGGYGEIWFTLQSIYPLAGELSAVRLPAIAAAWLRAHNLMRPDLGAPAASAAGVSYGQMIGAAPLLGPGAVQLDFDGAGTLRSLRYEHVTAPLATMWPAGSPAIAAAAWVDQGRGFYSGPTTSVITGTAAISGMSLAYVGVHGVTSDYLEPVYVLAGAVPTLSGAQPFTVYTTALQ